VSARVCLAEEHAYMEYIGIPLQGNCKTIHVSDLEEIDESPFRIPARFATQLYISGESGMGYTLFSIDFRCQLKTYHIGYSVLDFIIFPSGCNQSDIIRVLPCKYDPLLKFQEPPDYIWCLFSV